MFIFERRVDLGDRGGLRVRGDWGGGMERYSWDVICERKKIIVFIFKKEIEKEKEVEVCEICL